MSATHLIRFAVLGANEDASDIDRAQLHDDASHAAKVARALANRQAAPLTARDALLDAPYRVVTVRLEVDDPREDDEA